VEPRPPWSAPALIPVLDVASWPMIAGAGLASRGLLFPAGRWGHVVAGVLAWRLLLASPRAATARE
jgi:hypothetical protein